MTQDEIIEMAKQAGLSHFYDSEGHCTGITDADLVTADKEKNDARLVEILGPFAKLVAAKEREHYDDLFEQIKGWCEAYPIGVFSEPDFGKAHEVLKLNGMTLDAISASNMKHVITQVQKMIDAAIRARGEA